jgi:PhnB protein
MAKLNPYINFSGNTEEAFNFYKSVFGGEFATVMRYGEMPGCDELPEEKRVSEENKDKIMHIALPVGTDNVLMGTDALENFGPKLTEGNNFSISISAESKDEAENLFNGLAEGGTVTMPLADTFWGAYFGMLKDKFGIQWLVNHDYNQNK